MVLACISVADPSVLELAGKLRDFGFDATAARIEGGYEREALMARRDVTGTVAAAPKGRSRTARSDSRM